MTYIKNSSLLIKLQKLLGIISILLAIVALVGWRDEVVLAVLFAAVLGLVGWGLLRERRAATYAATSFLLIAFVIGIACLFSGAPGAGSWLTCGGLAGLFVSLPNAIRLRDVPTASEVEVKTLFAERSSDVDWDTKVQDLSRRLLIKQIVIGACLGIGTIILIIYNPAYVLLGGVPYLVAYWVAESVVARKENSLLKMHIADSASEVEKKSRVLDNEAGRFFSFGLWGVVAPVLTLVGLVLLLGKPMKLARYRWWYVAGTAFGLLNTILMYLVIADRLK